MTNQQLLTMLSEMKGYRYKMWEYQVSHSVLRIRAMPTKNDLYNPTHIEFRDVTYIEMPLAWESGDLREGSKDQFYVIAEKINLKQPYDRYLTLNGYKLFEAQTSNGQVYILGKLGKIEFGKTE